MLKMILFLIKMLFIWKINKHKILKFFFLIIYLKVV